MCFKHFFDSLFGIPTGIKISAVVLKNCAITPGIGKARAIIIKK